MTKKWLRAAIVRAVKTMAQAAVAQLGANSVGLTQIDWLGILSISVVSSIISILTSIAGLPEVDNVK